LSSAAAAAAPAFQRGEKASVLIFTTTDCPIANAMLPELARLQEAFAPKGVSFTLVHVDPDTTPASAQEHAKSYKVTVPMVLDPKHALVKRYHATRTPEAFVILPDDTIVYHGRINDLYHAPGQRRRSPSTNDLKDALAAVVSERPVPNAYQPAIGCVIADFAK
jgi:thiol-disulfide isomerase/thioredoxin